MYISVYEYVHMSKIAHWSRKRLLYALVLELQVVVLGNELWSSTRPIPVLKLWAIAPAPILKTKPTPLKK